MNPEALAGWVPIRLYWDGSRPMADWCRFGTVRFGEPFFDETVEKRLHDPFSLLFRHRTPLELLVALRQQRPGLAPSGFIFHMSRCGSTLLAQMLASAPENIVLSEAGPIDWVLRAHRRHPAVTAAERRSWLRGVVSALGQARSGVERRYFIKFDAWHITELPVIRAAFPDVPWVFLYRDPVEVLVSHERRRGAQMVPGAFLGPAAGLDLATAASMPAEDYAAHVLRWICEAALLHRDRGGRFIPYRDLPRAGLCAFLAHCDVTCSEEELDQMLAVARMDAKRPGVPFAPDGTGKREEASSSLLRAVEERLGTVYERLEAVARAGVSA